MTFRELGQKVFDDNQPRTQFGSRPHISLNVSMSGRDSLNSIDIWMFVDGVRYDGHTFQELWDNYQANRTIEGSVANIAETVC